jgi:hypothetical protein
LHCNNETFLAATDVTEVALLNALSREDESEHGSSLKYEVKQYKQHDDADDERNWSAVPPHAHGTHGDLRLHGVVDVRERRVWHVNGQEGAQRRPALRHA